MKETGIIMSGNHPKLILDGVKTMTRRTWGLEKINKDPNAWLLASVFQDGLARFYSGTNEELTLKCPYGGYGDRLWVRETWQYEDEPRDFEEDELYTWIFYADSECRLINRKTGNLVEEDILTADSEDEMKWRPSIFMPRWASRIDLEITGLRVERLQDITEEDAIAEGLRVYFETVSYNEYKAGTIMYSLLSQFKTLWDSLNAKRGYGWETNPWVWPISFKLLEKGY